QPGAERSHRRITTTSPAPTHRSGGPVTPWSRLELPRTKLRAAIRVNDTPGNHSRPATTGHSIINRRHSQARFHPRIDGIADDSVAEHVLDRAHVQLALTGVVFGNVGQPQLVDCLGSEVAFDEVVTHWRAGLLAVFPGSFDRVREQLLLRAQPPHTTL